MSIVYLSLGSNSGNRLKFINLATDLLNIKIGRILKKSDIFESESWNYSDNDYLNSVIKLESLLKPQEILDKCKKIEIKLGRNNKTKIVDGKAQYSSRVIDIDILFFDNQVIKTKELTIPHPLLQNRNFVLKPLMQISPNFIHPVLKVNMQTLYKNCTDESSINLFSKL